MGLSGVLGTSDSTFGGIVFGLSPVESPAGHLPTRASINPQGFTAEITPLSLLAAVVPNGSKAAIDPFETEAEVIE